MEKLTNSELNLLSKFSKSDQIAISNMTSEEKNQSKKLLSLKLISPNIFVGNDGYVDFDSYSITNEGKRTLELANDQKKYEKTIHIWYPTIVNITYAIIGFFIGWFLKSLFH